MLICCKQKPYEKRCGLEDLVVRFVNRFLSTEKTEIAEIFWGQQLPTIIQHFFLQIWKLLSFRFSRLKQIFNCLYLWIIVDKEEILTLFDISLEKLRKRDETGSFMTG